MSDTRRGPMRRLMRGLGFFFLILAVAALAVPLWGLAPDDTGRGEALLARREYAAAREVLTRAGRGGSARAVLLLGRMAANGQDGPPDPARALSLYRRAADMGSLEAQRITADMLSDPRPDAPDSPTPEDLSQAASWYRKAGGRGDNEARFRAGLCYATGRGAPQSPDKALLWLDRAARRDHPRALAESARLRLDLADSEKDPSRAARLTDRACADLRRAADLGYAPAMRRLGELALDGRLPQARPGDDLVWFTRAAQAGDAESRFIMGRRVERGEGLPSFPLEAARWYRLAADSGHVAAMLRLADMYFDGRGVFRDRKEAGRLRAAAGEKDAAARAGLCVLYAAGDPAARDYGAAAAWCRRAAQDGDARSRYLYGLLLTRGLGVPRDELESAKWLAAAAGQGLPEAQYVLALLYLGGRGVVRDASEAFSLCRKAAEQGLPEAQTLLASMYDEELRTTRNYAQALRWYRRAAGAGDVTAQFNLASMFGKGVGVPADPAQALEWFTRAARDNDPRAAFNVGLLILSGAGGAPDPAQALDWFLKAARAGDARARLTAALMYQSGQGTPHNPREAFRLARLAAHQGLPQAQAMLGAAYFEGRIVARDLPESLYWLTLATRQPTTEYPVQTAVAARQRVEKRLAPDQVAAARQRAAAFTPLAADPGRENDGLAAVRFLETPPKKSGPADAPAAQDSEVYGLF